MRVGDARRGWVCALALVGCVSGSSSDSDVTSGPMTTTMSGNESSTGGSTADNVDPETESNTSSSGSVASTGPEDPQAPPVDLCPDRGIVSFGDEVVEIECGTHAMTEVLTAGGSADRWIRYRPAEPECVVFEGGDTPSDLSYVVLDGFTFDANLGDGAGVVIRADHVGIERAHVIGPLDVHTGVPSCSEDAVNSTGFSFAGHSDAWISDSEIHGFSSAIITFGGRDLRVSCNYVHNNFNGISPTGTDIFVEGNVLWMHPNHVLLVEDNADDVAEHHVVVAHNLVVDTQESLFLYGGASYDFHHNTWWGELQECGTGVGLQILDRAEFGNTLPQGPLRFTSNLFGGAAFNNVVRLELPVSGLIEEMNHNYGYRPDSATRWARDTPADRNWTLEQWRRDTGFDGASYNGSSDPLLEAPTIQPIPATYEEAWERFRPRASSPLCGAGMDGTDVGAVPCGS